MAVRLGIMPRYASAVVFTAIWWLYGYQNSSLQRAPALALSLICESDWSCMVFGRSGAQPCSLAELSVPLQSFVRYVESFVSKMLIVLSPLYFVLSSHPAPYIALALLVAPSSSHFLAYQCPHQALQSAIPQE